MKVKSQALFPIATTALLFAASLAIPAQQQFNRLALGSPTIPDPISVYDNWSAYDELSDNVPLTEELSINELDQLLRLRASGARFDYYVMDAFWFDPDGGYRTWKKPNWPNGPWNWIKQCQQNGIRPGLWFSTNTLVKLNAAPQWRDSLNSKGTAMSMFEGGFLPDFMGTLQYWYDHGIRMFLFDFADLTAATPQSEKALSQQQIIDRNSTALRHALAAFRRKNPDVVLEAFNGFGGEMDTTYYAMPFAHPVDLRWLEVFDALYCGDPRPADVPEMNFWRSLDIYSDHQVRRYQQTGVPLERIDSTSFMPGKTGTNYRRAFHAWKGSLMLMMARGGWIDTTFGNLELMSADDTKWYARVQTLFLHLQSEGRIKSFGGIPGDIQPYGFGALDTEGSVYVVVNPTQQITTIHLPLLSQLQPALSNGHIQFRDAGFTPVLHADTIDLGPGQMAMVGFGKYAAPAFDFGIQQDVIIPRAIRAVAAHFGTIGKGIIQATIAAPAGGDLRLIMQQDSPDGSLRRSWPVVSPDGKTPTMGKTFLLKAEQNGRPVPIHEEYDREIWAGLSWAAGEISGKDLQPGAPLTLTFQSMEKQPVTLKGRLYLVQY